MTTVLSAVQTPVIEKVISTYFGIPVDVTKDKLVPDLTKLIVNALEQLPPLKNVILTQLLYLGDRVVMNMDKEDRANGRKGVPDGTVGTVYSIYRYKRYYSRYGDGYQEPGIYEIDGARYIRWDNFIPPEWLNIENR